MNNYFLNENVFREYDIRGIVKEDFSNAFIYDLGKAMGTIFLERGSEFIGVSGDIRKTTHDIKAVLIKGLVDTGINVVDLGELPTPVNYYSMYALEKINCTVQITGSHNSFDYNGFKISYNKQPFYGKDISKLKKTMIKGDFKEGIGKIEYVNLLDSYGSLLKDKIFINRKISIAMDCLNSSALLIAPKIFNDLDIDLIKINCNKDDYVSNAPDPTIDENLKELAEKTKINQCDFGVAYDGDADRLVIVDEKGQIIRSDILLALFSLHLISKGDCVVFDVKCSKAVEEIIKRKNGKPIMYKTGHSYIKKKMHESGAVLGGEMSGHIFFADDYFGYDDAIYASLRLCQLISESNKKISDFIKEIPRFYSSPEIRIECDNDEEKFRISNKLITYFKSIYDCNCIDGVRIEFDNGWGLIRASNTQPVLVCRFEASTKVQLENIQSIIMSQIKKYIKV